MDYVMTLLGCLALAVIFPIGIFVSRRNVRGRRQDIISQLEGLFRRQVTTAPMRQHQASSASATAQDKSTPAEHEWDIVPSFEFVKSKYFEPSTHDNTAFGNRVPRQEPKGEWFSLPVLIYVLLSAICLYAAVIRTVVGCFDLFLLPTARDTVDGGCSASYSIFLFGDLAIGAEPPEHRQHFLRTMTVVCFAFFGAYIATIRALIRAVSNFDLSPLTFFRANIHIICTIVLAVVFWKIAGFAGDALLTVPDLAPLEEAGRDLGFGMFILAATLFGLHYRLADRILARYWTRGHIKRENRLALEETTVVPLELISGIDQEIRSRLEDHNLLDVQNLAYANPIMLFVETPYGIYQSIDWVAQAQLANSVGVTRFIALQAIGVRTIFDLGAVYGFCPCAASEGTRSEQAPEVDWTALQTRVTQVLTGDTAATLQPQAGGALVSVYLRDLAVRRLYQICQRIGERLPSIVCPKQPAGRVGNPQQITAPAA
ncbi:hypothetical protein [Elioraea sp.]|uniref:hypothetical protein n=1 Tax=Elioraea sp. TaxID=2185103 RepID=UPI0025BB4950|nr:hypothetical protein [Elioraea sp.]